ncbi:MAG: site-specific DNA-methyltransferase [Oscillospiraceae bacterium]|nr:site-specific DNA-methyltransferase [Oscillospiraceae bacterium]
MNNNLPTSDFRTPHSTNLPTSDFRVPPLSLDIELTEREKLRSLFPQCFTDGTLNIDKLLEVCGEFIAPDENDRERYEFRWHGKQDCMKLAGKRSTGTLRPCVDESVEWDSTQNVYIEGDNLEVLKILQTAYFRKVKMIYIDPPYNTGNDFVYADDFADPLERYREVTAQTTKSNPEYMGRFHTNWLNMMYPRLRLAANLLRDDGVIFISIDDGEVQNLRKVCEEVFGEENFVAQIPWRKRTAKSDVPFGVSQDYEWVLVFAKSSAFAACLEGGTRKYYETDDLKGKPWRIHDLTKQTSASERPNSFFTMVNPKTGKEYPANPNRTWAITQETFKKYYAENRIVFPGDYDFLNISKPAFRYFKEDDMAKAGDKFGYIPVSTNLPNDIGMTQDGTKEITDIFGNKVFGFPKPIALLKYLIKAATIIEKDESPIILDFFSGSATTAHAVMQLNAEDGGNRKFICVQLPEVTDEKSEAFKAGYKNICEIGKERIRRAGAKIKAENTLTAPDLDTGFKVFKLDSSNLKLWDNSPITGEDAVAILEERMRGVLEPIKSDRSDEDIVYEVMLKLGQELTLPIVPLSLTSGRVVYGVGAEVTFIVCLAYGVTAEDALEMAEYAPGRIVFADGCFDNTEQKSNVRLSLKDKGISIKVL